MTTELNFSKNGDIYEASFASTGKCVVELERKERGTVTVYANIEGMPKCCIAVIEPTFQPSAAFEVDVMAGMMVTVRSVTEVVTAKIIGNADTQA